jgi:hypothetical protein
MLTLHVAPNGNDQWSGSLASPNAPATDGPLATITGARDRLRHLRDTKGLPSGGAEIILAPGGYVLDAPFDLGRQDSGQPNASIVIRGSTEGRSRILGGQAITAWHPVTDPNILRRLAPEVRDRVLFADLAQAGIADPGSLSARGFLRPTRPAHLELFVDGEPMALSRYPTEEWLTITGLPDQTPRADAHGGTLGLQHKGFLYDDPAPRSWALSDDIWAYGYWDWDWSGTYERVDILDPERGLVVTAPPYCWRGFRVGQRFAFLNVLEALTQPGSYYVHREAGRIYLLPPEGAALTDVWASTLEDPMVRLDNVEHVVLRNLTLEVTRGDAIVIQDGADCAIERCTIRNIGNRAVVINGGTRHTVTACDMSEIGDGTVEIRAGDRETLTPCEHTVSHCHMHQFSRWVRCYTPAVQVWGVGAEVAHNHMHDAPHSAVIYWGNENRIHHNHIHHVTMETGDCGAIYTGRDYTARGNVVAHNWIHDTGGVGMGSMGVYLDDCVSGQIVEHNILERCARAVFIGGGRDNLVRGNLLVDCHPALHIDGRGMDDSDVWRNMVIHTLKDRLLAMRPDEPPYSERYPELAETLAYYRREPEPHIPPEGNVIEGNVCVGGEWRQIGWNAKASHLDWGINLVTQDPAYRKAALGRAEPPDDGPALPETFEPIILDAIGPQGTVGATS